LIIIIIKFVISSHVAQRGCYTEEQKKHVKALQVKLADVNFEYTDSEANIEPTDTREKKSIYSYCFSFLEK